MTRARSVSDSSIVNFRNVLINGGFSIDQRFSGAPRTIVAGDTIANGYVVDRWYNYCTGANITGSRVSGSAPSQYYYRLTGATSNTGFGVGQRIEAANSFHLAGRVVTLSVGVASTSLTSITWTAFYANTTDAFGTLASPTRTQIATGTFTVSSTLSKKTATFTIPSAATTGIEIVFTGGALVASQTATFDDAQLEIGSSATLFEQRPIGLEFDLCRRYYERYTNANNYYFPQFPCNIDVANRPEVMIQYYPKRVAPVISSSGTITIESLTTTSNQATSNTVSTLVGTHLNSANLFLNVTTWTARDPAIFLLSGTGAWIEITAEL
jgi:hypothetical protein